MCLKYRMRVEKKERIRTRIEKIVGLLVLFLPLIKYI